MRHLQNCKTRLKAGKSIPVLPTKKRGKKRVSCDSCSRLKRACSRTWPCTLCSKRNLVCFFPPEDSPPKSEDSFGESSTPSSHTQAQLGFPDATGMLNSSFSMTDYLETRPTSLYYDQMLATTEVQPHFLSSSPYQFVPSPSCSAWSSSYLMPDSYRTSAKQIILEQLSHRTGYPELSFMVHFMALQNHGIRSIFSAGDFRRMNDATRNAGQQVYDWAKSGPNASKKLSSSPFLIRRQALIPPIVPSLPYASRSLDSSPSSPLMFKTQEIVSGIRLNWEENEMSLPWSPTVESHAFQLFAPSEIDRFLKWYWADWHINCPIMHRPTFDPSNAPGPLVASMVLMGASFCPDLEDHVAAAVYFQAVDRWTSKELESFYQSARHQGSNVNMKTLRVGADSLRASFIITLVYQWEGSSFGRLSIPVNRYDSLLCAARVLRANANGHGNIRQYLDPNDINGQWDRFAAIEGLIRMVTYVSIFDCVNCIFYNAKPRADFEDANFQIGCPEACFQAESAEIWRCTMNIWLNTELGKRQMTLKDAVAIMARPTMSPADQEVFKHMSTFNLFSIITCNDLTSYFQFSAKSSSYACHSILRSVHPSIWSQEQEHEHCAQSLERSLGQ
jgi:hypothetical protein